MVNILERDFLLITRYSKSYERMRKNLLLGSFRKWNFWDVLLFGNIFLVMVVLFNLLLILCGMLFSIIVFVFLKKGCMIFRWKYFCRKSFGMLIFLRLWLYVNKNLWLFIDMKVLSNIRRSVITKFWKSLLRSLMLRGEFLDVLLKRMIFYRRMCTILLMMLMLKMMWNFLVMSFKFSRLSRSLWDLS